MNLGLNDTSRVAAPLSDTRSFTEESQLFNGAGLGTPRPGSRSSRQETPSRSSARIAARKDSVKPQAGSLASQAEDEDDEDELATAPAQPRKNSLSGVSRSNTPKTFNRTEQASQSRERSRDLVSNDEAETPRPQLQSNGLNQQTRSSVVDALKAKLPIPNKLHTGRPLGQAGPSNSHPIARLAPELGRSGDSQPHSPRASGPSKTSASDGRPRDSVMEEPPRIKPQGGHAAGPHDLDVDRDPQDNNDQPESLFSVINDGLERILHFSKWPRWLVTGLQIWGLLTFFSIAFLILLQVFVPPNRWEGVKVSRNYTYTGIGNWRQNIAQFVPWVVLHPFAVLTGNLDYVDFRTALNWAEWNHQNNKIRLDYLAGATHQMRRILPELIAINVDKSSNEWSVGDSFWSALDEEMKHGGLHHSIMTLEKSADGTYIITDDHWDAILRRMQTEGMLISDQSGAVDNDVRSDQITSVVERTVSQRWDQWLKQNDDALKRVMGVDKEDMSAYYAEIFGDFEQKMLERVRNYNQEEQLVSRNEFIEKIQHVSNEYDVQIKAEMEAIEDKLRHAIDIIEDGKQTASLPDGMSREQVSEMIDAAIKRAVADAQLEFIAKGNIKGQLENELSGHKNYFSSVRGAIIDHSLSSTSYRWSSKGIMGEDVSGPSGLFSILSRKTNAAFRDGGIKAGIEYSAGKVLEKWDEDGECWCAGHADSDNSSRIADLSIMTADTVIPQHLVVEHITASGSFDPDAMPKDLEVWIRTPSDRRRRTLLEWSGNIWSDAKFGNGARLMAKGFVKIGEFKYLNSVGKGEKQVFRLSEDLLDLDAQTQQVIVRSKSNYGAQDHTCFYRLQLFGKEGKALERGVVD